MASQSASVIAQARSLLQTGRRAEALALLRPLADRGDPGTLYELAGLYWSGALVPRDIPMARECMRRASDAGHPQAGLVHTNFIASGGIGARDWPGALVRLRDEAATRPDRAAALALLAAMELTPDGDPVTLPAGETLSEAPHVVRFAALFSPAECAYLIAAAGPLFRPARIENNARASYQSNVRTCDEATFGWLLEDPAIHALNRRIAAVSDSDPRDGEPLLVLRYRDGQQFRPHVDALPGEANQRVRTMLITLSEGYAGGETQFPKAGLTVKGRPGDAILFRNTLADGRADPLSEHAGLPVTHGVKLLATRWIRERRYTAGLRLD